VGFLPVVVMDRNLPLNFMGSVLFFNENFEEYEA
jgi:hypothetical protein